MYPAPTPHHRSHSQPALHHLLHQHTHHTLHHTQVPAPLPPRHHPTPTCTFHPPQDTEPITALAVSPDCKTLVCASRSLLCKTYDLTTGAALRSWRGHKAPIADMAFDASAGYIATASADRSVKVGVLHCSWDQTAMLWIAPLLARWTRQAVPRCVQTARNRLHTATLSGHIGAGFKFVLACMTT